MTIRAIAYLALGSVYILWGIEQIRKNRQEQIWYKATSDTNVSSSSQSSQPPSSSQSITSELLIE